MLVTFFLIEGLFCLSSRTFRPLGAPLRLGRHREDLWFSSGLFFLGNLGLMIVSLRPLGAPLALDDQEAEAWESSAGFWDALGTFRDHFTHPRQIFTSRPMPELAQAKEKGPYGPVHA